MSIIVSNIRIALEENDEQAINIALKRLSIKKSLVKKAYISKKSLDARRKGNVSFVTSVIVDLFSNEAETVKAVSDSFVKYKEKTQLEFPMGNLPLKKPIVIVGFGPAGIFAAHTLVTNGYPVIVVEKGEAMDERVKSVNSFWESGALNSDSNVQFGEGGAGTFSDGKLTTRISDSRCDYVLDEFVRHGAPEEILYKAKPHIGTDKLRNVIKSIRNEIIEKGGEVRFSSNLEDIIIRNNKVKAVVVNGEAIETENVILAIGHSSRDTFKMLHKKGVSMINKDFSVGVRIEQLQSTIDKGLYGDLAGHKALPKGEYQLSYHQGNRCVYTFCMCPGGYVVPSASSENSVVTNGMSEHSRDGKNANSALVVSVSKDDFGNNPLGGMIFQEKLEQLAFLKGGSNYKAPAMTVGDFLSDKGGFSLGNVTPSYALGVTPTDFSEIFNEDIIKTLKSGLLVFDKKLHGFSNKDGILTGVETRTSSPVRINRNDDLQSVSCFGLYPCGEGAGYAGGIMSAAVDGIKVASKIIESYKPN